MQRLLILAYKSQISWSLRNQAYQEGKQTSRNSLTYKHIAPAHGDTPFSLATVNYLIYILAHLLNDRSNMIAQDNEIYEIHNQLTEDNRKLVPRNQSTADIRRSNLSNIHRTYSRCQTHTYTSEHTIEIESPEQRVCRCSMFKNQKLRIIRTESREEEKNTGNHKRLLSSEVRSHISRQTTSDDTADKGTRRRNAVPEIAIHKILSTEEESLQALLSTRNYSSIISKQQTSQHSHKDNAEKVRSTSFSLHDKNR